MYGQMTSNCDYENDVNINKNVYNYIMINEESCDVTDKDLLMCNWKMLFIVNVCWQTFMWYIACALMFYWVWKEREEHEAQEGVVIQGL